jgi:ABC-type cobalt transport system, permease component CbiQ and related transporters
VILLIIWHLSFSMYSFYSQSYGRSNEIYEAQIMRGARITAKELCNPANWKDVVNCLIIPTIIYGFMMARQISMAAKARKFQIDEKRTCWNGE